MECVAESDDAYLSDLAVLVDRKIATEGVGKICRWLIDFGRRECGEKRLRARPQRELAKALGISVSTVCESLQRLRNSGLVIQADGEYRLRLSQLVELAEVAQTMPEQTFPPADPATALAALGGRRVRQRSAVFGDVRQCSAVFGEAPVTVEEETLYSVFEPSTVSTVTVHRTGAEPNAANAASTEAAIQTLKDLPAWRALQRQHMRPNLDAQPLERAFLAACEAGLLRDEDRESFYTHAYDVARNLQLASPVACLMKRVALFTRWRLPKTFAGLARHFIEEHKL